MTSVVPNEPSIGSYVPVLVQAPVRLKLRVQSVPRTAVPPVLPFQEPL